MGRREWYLEPSAREVFGGFVFDEVEQVILLRGRNCLLCWRYGAIAETSGELAQAIWRAAATSGLFVPGINGQRLVRPYRMDLVL